MAPDTVLAPMHTLLSWLSENSLVVSSLASGSVVLLALTVLAIPRVVSHLPADYLLNRLDQPLRRDVPSLMFSGLRAILGLFIVCLGLIMMVTPGPGVIMLLLGLSVAQFPGKHRLLIYLATRPQVFKSLNWMRQRHAREPFRHPHAGK
ncbi:MAG: hypothetical protein HKN42_16040 [Granulosicoccus sp.]|nr:hypothetical protein [Granulosicoccus sp.]